MKRTIFGWECLLLVLAFGVILASCDDGGGNNSGGNNTPKTPKDVLDGTTWVGSLDVEEWETINYVLTFDSPNCTVRSTVGGQTQTIVGTYTISGSTVTLNFNIEGSVPMTGTLSGNTLSFASWTTFTKQ